MYNLGKLLLLLIFLWPNSILAGGLKDDFKKCPEQRPEMCAQMYAPVCAVRDTGIRCIKAPCPSTEKATYSNGCMACSDPKVLGFRPEACDDE